MERSAFFTAALLSATAVFSSACNDLGSCDDPAKGRTTVVYADQLMFTGQAIINSSCANCHGSGAKGTARQGAPAGLDFDLLPISDGTPTPSAGTPTGLQLDAKKLSGLRSRQRKVYEERELIWEQVEKGLMPPKGFDKVMQIAKAMFGSDRKCTVGAKLTTLDEHKEDFRNWLACDTPIVEASSDKLPYKEFASTATEADKAAGSAYYSIVGVSVGYQYPSCGGGSVSPGGPTFSELYAGPFATCSGCHPSVDNGVDFTSEQKAYESLLGANGQGKPQTKQCATNTVPYVTPGDPAKSYLLPKLDSSSTAMRCGDAMPLGTGLSQAQIAQVRAWIMAGAPRTGNGAGGGSDAGASDAGVADGGDAGR